MFVYLKLRSGGDEELVEEEEDSEEEDSEEEDVVIEMIQKDSGEKIQEQERRVATMVETSMGDGFVLERREDGVDVIQLCWAMAGNSRALLYLPREASIASDFIGTKSGEGAGWLSASFELEKNKSLASIAVAMTDA